MIDGIVLTGAPGSGKSSILKELEFVWQERVIHEAAEDMIKYLQAKGNPKPWEDPVGFQDKIIKLQLQRETQVELLEGRVFLDRGIMDGLAYYQAAGMEPNELMKWAVGSCKAGRYQRVFLIEIGNNCQKTDVRKENIEEARILQEFQYQNYSEAGYDVERIPYIPIAERAEIILRGLKELKGGEMI